ncbi:MAG: M28 family peptidase [Alphaproteobacteria bacterium]|nr:M28 family peptidase [Alphaproteobacteria bacterium]
MKRTLALTAALALAACADIETGGPAKDPGVMDFPGHTATKPSIEGADFAARTKALADDRFEGRGPGTPRGETAADWIAAEMQRIGLKPGANGSYFQNVPAASITLDPTKSSFEISGTQLKFADEVAFWTPRFDKDDQAVKNSDLIFVGYGVNAPEAKWNDFKGVNVKGKTIVLMINDPGFITRDETLFKGRAMTYYGRWTYKFEEAARRGAAAVIIIHETEPAAYGWNVVRNSNTGAKYYLDRPNGNKDYAAVHSWITTDTAKALFARAGLDYDKLRLAANKRGFRAVPMKGLKLNATLHSTVSKMQTRNVVGIVPGTAKPNEYVLYTAHWDHLGVKPDVPGKDKIHNGALDNASGTAAILEMAETFAAAPPRRSVMFAAVTLEEQGLLGSEYLAKNPPVKLKQIVAGMNFDGVGPSSPAHDMTVVGSGASELEDLLAAALKKRNRTVSPDPEPEKGSFYRSDHISLAKAGVPMLYAGQGIDLVEGGKEAGLAKRQDYTKNRYHQPSDEFKGDWDLRGPVETMTVMYEVGNEIANGTAWPTWHKDNEFYAIRKKSLKAK